MRYKVKKMITYPTKYILKISVPLILGMLIQVLVGVTDTAFLGRVGEVELGASAIAGIVYLLAFMVSQSFASGAQIIMARRNGEQHYSKIARVLYQTLTFIVLFSALNIVLFYLFAPAGFEAALASQAVAEASAVYLSARCWGLFMAGATAVFRAFFVAVTNTAQLFWAALILLVSNFILDYWLIFGGLGVPAMGIKGAAVASVIAESVSAAYLILYMLKKVDLIKYGFQKFLLWNQALFLDIFRLSIWIVIQNILSWGVWLYFFIEIEKLGENALAVSNILRSVSSLPFIFANAMSLAASSLVSNLIGCGKDDEVMPTAARLLKIGSVFYYGCLGVMAVFPTAFLRIYTDNPVVITEALAPFGTMILTYLSALPAMIYFYCILGTGKTRVALGIEIICSLVYIITVRLIVGVYEMSLAWCWTSEMSYYLLLLAISYAYMKRNKWCCELV